jgi:hypothetical protein
MTHFGSRILLACACILFASAIPSHGRRVDDEPRKKLVLAESPATVDQKRGALWLALTRALPQEYQHIDAYAENSTITTVLFYSHGSVLKFAAAPKKLEVIPIKKRLGTLNRITFEEEHDGGTWCLWFNGRREATIDDRVIGAGLESGKQ